MGTSDCAHADHVLVVPKYYSREGDEEGVH